MEDPKAFRAAHPDLCEVADDLLPGPDRMPDRPPRPVAKDAVMEALDPEPEADGTTLPAMLKHGPDAVAWYRSFRVDPEGYGIYVDLPRLAGLRAEFHRILWRDLETYSTDAVAEVLPLVEYSLALDLALAHARFHQRVDYATAVRELGDGTARYGTYRTGLAAAKADPPKDPRFVVDIEEALANLEGFTNYINPTYGENVARVVEGRVDDRDLQEWRSFFVGGRWATEIANAFSRHPSGYRDFTKFVYRSAKVGAFNYIRVQYAMNRQLQEEGWKELCRRIDGEEYRLVENTEYENFLDLEVPEPPYFVL